MQRETCDKAEKIDTNRKGQRIFTVLCPLFYKHTIKIKVICLA